MFDTQNQIIFRLIIVALKTIKIYGFYTIKFPFFSGENRKYLAEKYELRDKFQRIDCNKLLFYSPPLPPPQKKGFASCFRLLFHINDRLLYDD